MILATVQCPPHRQIDHGLKEDTHSKAAQATPWALAMNYKDHLQLDWEKKKSLDNSSGYIVIKTWHGTTPITFRLGDGDLLFTYDLSVSHHWLEWFNERLQNNAQALTYIRTTHLSTTPANILNAPHYLSLSKLKQIESENELIYVQKKKPEDDPKLCAGLSYRSLLLRLSPYQWAPLLDAAIL